MPSKSKHSSGKYTVTTYLTEEQYQKFQEWAQTNYSVTDADAARRLILQGISK